MRVPRLFRILAAVTLLLFAFLFYLTLSGPSISSGTGPLLSNVPEQWHDPNNDLIDEPPGPLHRVNGKNYAPNNAHSDRINAAIISLVRNSELNQLLPSIRDLERTFNHKFNYPWIFFNDEPFTRRFKEAVRAQTNAKVSFELIPPEHWQTPAWIDRARYDASAQTLYKSGVQYAANESYHRMCRWNSGPFAQHPALADMDYYWRVEPNVRFFCAVDYDVFRYLADRNKTYGFAITLYDAPQSIPSLWPATEAFLADPANAAAVHPRSAESWVRDRAHRPAHHDAAHGYSTCHFWSNFEIGKLAFWRSPLYQRYFEHLDRAGGFFYERWGDAPVHSIALGLFEDRERLHWFRDIGYQHVPFFNCPRRPPGKCQGCRPGLLTDGARFLYEEDCRPSWLHHVGLGEWSRFRQL